MPRLGPSRTDDARGPAGRSTMSWARLGHGQTHSRFPDGIPEAASGTGGVDWGGERARCILHGVPSRAAGVRTCQRPFRPFAGRWDGGRGVGPGTHASMTGVGHDASRHGADDVFRRTRSGAGRGSDPRGCRPWPGMTRGSPPTTGTAGSLVGDGTHPRLRGTGEDFPRPVFGRSSGLARGPTRPARPPLGRHG